MLGLVSLVRYRCYHQISYIFGVGGNGDGKIELDTSPEDTIFTVAEFIKSNGCKSNQSWF